MKIPHLVYISSISGRDIGSAEELIRDERLFKHLWTEFILNPDLIRSLTSYADNNNIKDAITDALSWYLAFRWIFPDNPTLDELYKNGVIVPYRISNKVYRQKIRGFLKGLLYAGLC